MKIMKCVVTNFGSYGGLEFDFNDLGLTLVSGATGSGKSTLFDVAAWIMYGVTAKNGGVDEVRSWKAGDAPTAGCLQIETQSGTICISRVRGKQADNDLFYVDHTGEKIRGKDLKDTQLRINEVLSATADVYLASAYFSEFSKVASFFSSTAQNRRHLLDIIADTTLADRLAKKTNEQIKANIPVLASLGKKVTIAEVNLINTNKHLNDTESYCSHWVTTQDNKKQEYIAKRDKFDLIKQSRIEAAETACAVWRSRQIASAEKLSNKLASLTKDTPLPPDTSPCVTCGKAQNEQAQLRHNHLIQQIDDLKQELKSVEKTINPGNSELEYARNMQNEFQKVLDTLEAEKNPYSAKVEDASLEVKDAEGDLINANLVLEDNKNKVSLLDDLKGISISLRGELVKKAIKDLQDQANVYLEKFFDSEIRLALSVPDNDSVEVSIRKNGYECVYSQLSKGQRGLLKLCFSISVMAAASNKAGVHFDNLFLDEALDGLDADLKVKAFNLLSDLSNKHGTVMVIDHSTEFKSCFPRQYEVELKNDESEIYES